MAGSDHSPNGGNALAVTQFCSDCGARLPAGARFCAACGHPVATATDTPAAEPTTVQLPREEPVVTQLPPLAPDGMPVESDTAPPRPPTAESVSAPPVPPTAESLIAPPQRPGGEPPRTRRPRLTGRAALAGGAGLLVLAAIAAAVLILAPSDDSRQRVSDELRAAAQDVGQVARAGSEADTLAAMVAVGEQAELAGGRVDASLRELATVEDASLARAGRATLSAERDMLGAFAQLAALKPQRLADWQDIDRDLTRARLALSQTEPGLE
jgi:hypothetical protein